MGVPCNRSSGMGRTSLLVNNYEPGDFAMCASQMPQLEDVDEAHHLVGSLLDLCSAHPGSEALDCLLYVYEFSPCVVCRRRAVKEMIDVHTAPGWLLQEGAFDADPQTRALVAAVAGSLEVAGL